MPLGLVSRSASRTIPVVLLVLSREQFLLSSMPRPLLIDKLTIFSNVGAVAELLDISCFINNPLFETLPDIAIAAWEGTPDKISTLDLINDLRTPLGPAVLGEFGFLRQRQHA